MKKILAILVCLSAAVTIMVGCNNDDKVPKKNASNVNQIEEWSDNDINVNMDIRDTSMQLQSTQVDSGELEGEKVFALGVVSSIDLDGENMNKVNFIITQTEGNNSVPYVATWEGEKLNFQSLQIEEGDIIKIYGVLEGKNKKGAPIIKTSLIDLAT